jgi:glycine/D-amino acid oxidase-like deaminating enzyme
MFGDSTTGMYGRSEAGGQQILAGSIRPEDEQDYIDNPENYNEACDPDFREARLHSIHHRFPGCRGNGNIRGYTGIYCINTEDMHPIIGETNTKGYFVANGYSGHGFKLAPSSGSLIAKMVTDTNLSSDTKIDEEFLSPKRTPLKLDSMCVLA